MRTPIRGTPVRRKYKMRQQKSSTVLAMDESLRTTVWFTLLAIGLLGMFSYFFHIEYFPNFDLAAASSLLLSSAYVYLLILPMLSALFLAPYLLHAVNLRFAAPKNDSEPPIRRIAIRAGGCAAQLVVLGISLGACAWFEWHPGFGLLTYFIGIALIYGVLLARSTRAAAVDPSSKLAKFRPRLHTLLADTVITGLLQVSSLFLLWLFIAQGSPAQQENWWIYCGNIFWVAASLGVAGGLLMHSLTQPWGRQRAFVLIPVILFVPFIVTALIQGTGAIPMTVARLTKIGNFRAETLFIKGSACAKLPAELGVSCSGNEDALKKICNVHIMSRVGGETYLRLAIPRSGVHGDYVVVPLFLPTDQVQPAQIDTTRKFMHLGNIDRTLRQEGSVCQIPAADASVILPFEKHHWHLSVAANARLHPVVQRLKQAPETVREVSIIGYAADDEEKAESLDRQRALETWMVLSRELRTLDRRSTPALQIRAGREGDKSPCGSTYTAAECADAQRRVEIRLVLHARAGSVAVNRGKEVLK